MGWAVPERRLLDGLELGGMFRMKENRSVIVTGNLASLLYRK